MSLIPLPADIKCARDRVLYALGYSGLLDSEFGSLIDTVADDVLSALGIDPSSDMTPHYMIQRTDGEDIFGECAWYSTKTAADWEIAEIESDDADEPVEYEIVTHVYTHATRRTFGAAEVVR